MDVFTKALNAQRLSEAKRFERWQYEASNGRCNIRERVAAAVPVLSGISSGSRPNAVEHDHDCPFGHASPSR
jgi:hypothetical protein